MLMSDDNVVNCCLVGDVTGSVAALAGGGDTGDGLFTVADLPSPPGPGLISLPCRELGGGGFFLIEAAGCRLGCCEPPATLSCPVTELKNVCGVADPSMVDLRGAGAEGLPALAAGL